jgi:hypothetical protein
MASNELDIDKMLREAEKGKSPSTYGAQPGGVYGIGSPKKPAPSPEPDQKKNTMPPPKSYAPKGMGNAVKGDLGYYRGVEAGRAFANPIKKAGRTGACAKPLTYRKPAIEGGEGPHAV